MLLHLASSFSTTCAEQSSCWPAAMLLLGGQPRPAMPAKPAKLNYKFFNLINCFALGQAKPRPAQKPLSVSRV